MLGSDESLSNAFMALAKAEASIARLHDARARALIIIAVFVIALIVARAVVVMVGRIRENT